MFKKKALTDKDWETLKSILQCDDQKIIELKELCKTSLTQTKNLLWILELNKPKKRFIFF